MSEKIKSLIINGTYAFFLPPFLPFDNLLFLPIFKIKRK